MNFLSKLELEEMNLFSTLDLEDVQFHNIQMQFITPRKKQIQPLKSPKLEDLFAL